MKTTTKIIPLRLPSAADDYLSADGEIASYSNLISSSDDVAPDASGTPLPEPTFSLTLPPPPRVEFSLRRTILPGWHVHPDTLPTRLTDVKDSSDSALEKGVVEILRRLDEDATTSNLFLRPFLVLAAWRLRDGSHLLSTSPVLMIPNSEPFAVETDAEESEGKRRMNVAAAICRLQWRLSLTDPPNDSDEGETIADLSSFGITALDIMATTGIETADLNAGLSDFRHLTPTSFSHSLNTSGLAGEHPVTATTLLSGKRYPPRSQSQIMADILDSSSFRCISSIPLTRLADMEAFEDVEIESGLLARFSSLPEYTPDYAHHSGIAAAGKSLFSGRTTLFDITVTPPAPTPLRYLTPYTNVAGYQPRFIFHPDPERSVFPVTIEGKGYSLPLRPHPTLHGAYRLLPLNADTEPEEISSATHSYSPSSSISINALAPIDPSEPRRYPAMIWRSAKGNELLFPDSLRFNLDAGRVIYLCSAFRSAGLVATTSPTAYLFTTEGIYLLREQEDGSMRDAGLISGYIPRDADSIISGAEGITFTDSAGRLIRIEGTKATPVGKSSASYTLILTGKGEEIDLLTRPLKFGKPEMDKQILSVAVRGRLDASALTITLEGSRDLRQWHTIATRTDGRITGLWCTRSRFFRVRVEGALPAGDTISAIKFELRVES